MTWTVLSVERFKDDRGQTRYNLELRCSGCGLEVERNEGQRTPRSSGCHRCASAQFRKPLPIGTVFHSWTTLAEQTYGQGSKNQVQCRCVCGRVKMVALHNLRAGYSKSCGKGSCKLKPPSAKPMEPTPQAIRILVAIARLFPILSRAPSHREIAEYVGTRAASIHAKLDQLARLGLLVREQETERNKRIVGLSDAGREFVARQA